MDGISCTVDYQRCEPLAAQAAIAFAVMQTIKHQPVGGERAALRRKEQALGVATDRFTQARDAVITGIRGDSIPDKRHGAEALYAEKADELIGAAYVALAPAEKAGAGMDTAYIAPAAQAGRAP